MEETQKVKEIIVEKGKAVGIKTEKIENRFDLILSNVDIFPTYKNLLRDQKAPKRILRQERSSSAVIFYWGIKNQFDQIDFVYIQNSPDLNTFR